MSKPRRAAEPARVAPVFAALGDTTRLALLGRLGAGVPLSITALAEGSSLTRQGVTKHLEVMHRAGLVASRRQGREVRYAVVPQTLVEVRLYLDRASTQWDEAIGRLKLIVED